MDVGIESASILRNNLICHCWRSV